ncbi:MAG: alkaline phosphatase [Chloroflexi bacterium]|nr:alkaline phosphatase [Chloroflexota bacterium]
MKKSYSQYLLILFCLCFPAGCAPPATPSPSPTTAGTIASTPIRIPPQVTKTSTATLSPSASPTSIPSPAPITTVRFAVIGDYGEAGDTLQAVADLVISWEPDFIITTGDNNYPNGEAATIDANIGQYFHQFIFPYSGIYGQGAEENLFFPTLGNHDWNTNDAQPYLDYFTLPGNERYYDFEWGPVHLFSIDSDSREPDGIGRSTTQATWLREALAESTAPWKVVYTHLPPFSSGHHGSQLALQWPFQEWGASLVLAGHDHVYERLEIDGFPYFVNGLGGSSVRYNFEEPISGSQVRYRQMSGAMLVEASSNQIRLSFINVVGEIIDTYTLSQE